MINIDKLRYDYDLPFLTIMRNINKKHLNINFNYVDWGNTYNLKECLKKC